MSNEGGKRRMVKKRRIEEMSSLEEPFVAVEKTHGSDDLRQSLEEIKSYEGVIGYILRNTTSATVDLKDPSKIIDYAILSSTAFDTAEELAALFHLGKVENSLIRGKDSKMLSLTIDENRISIFLDNSADCERILKKISPP